MRSRSMWSVVRDKSVESLSVVRYGSVWSVVRDKSV